MKKPVTRPPKPPRRARLIRPTLAEDIAIMRGIAADPDNPESKKADFRRARPLSELIECRTRMAAKRAKQAMTETRKGSWAKPYDAANYLKTEETMWLYLANAQADGDPHLIEMAESAIEAPASGSPAMWRGPMTWNYRVVEFRQGDEHWRAVHEVYYDAAGKPVGLGATAAVHWDVDEGDETGLRVLARIRAAFDKPILTAAELTTGERR